MRLSTVTDLRINAFSGAAITELESGITNGVVEKSGDKVYVTQRPSIDIFEDASVSVSDARGRGIFYWAETNALYMVNNNKVYKTSYGASGSTIGTIGTGTKKVKFLVIGTTLILLDQENDQGWTITTGGTLTEITDSNFPPKQTPNLPIAYGGAVLDKYLFVLTESGLIHNSNLSTPGTWTALDYIEAEREPDKGVYLGTHHDNLAVLGVSTIEFFYDASNTTGSPLSRRQDVAYNIGCSDGATVWEEGDRIFFVGANYSGGLGVYTLESFQIRKISSESIDSFLNQALVKDGYTAFGSGVTAQGHTFYFLTLCSTPSDISPQTTLVYDDTTGLWGDWETTANSLTEFPVVEWTKRQGTTVRYGEGILSNGDLITFNDNLTPVDTVIGDGWVASGWVELGWVSAASDVGTNITLKTRLGMYDGGSSDYKYPKSAKAVSSTTTASQTLTLKWADDNNSSFSAGRSLDTSTYQTATRLPRFRRRNHELSYAGSEQIRIEALELT